MCLPHIKRLCALTTQLFSFPLIPTSPLHPSSQVVTQNNCYILYLVFKSGICIGIELFSQILPSIYPKFYT